MKACHIIIIVLVLSVNNTALSQDKFDQIMVDQEWLIDNQDNPDLVLLHVGKEEDFNESRIPGGQLITRDDFAVTRGDLYWEIPDEKDFKKTMRAYGISNDSWIVLYYGNDTFAATFRLYMTLEYFGMDENVRILDGGLKGWKYRERPLESGSTSIKKVKGKIDMKSNPEILADKDEVLNAIQSDNIKILDARRDFYYSGKETGNYARGGHIKNAGNITWLNLVDENYFLKDPAVLKEYFSQAGVGEDSEVITYCHVGLRASMLYTISKGLGYETRLYDGSFNEWDGLTDEYPTEKN